MAEIKTVLTDDDMAALMRSVGHLRLTRDEAAFIRRVEAAVLSANAGKVDAPASSAMAMQAVDAQDLIDAKRWRWWRDENLSFRAWFKTEDKISHVPDKKYLSDIIDNRTDEVMRESAAMQSQQSPVQASDAGRQG